jgi:hypothetical protein
VIASASQSASEKNQTDQQQTSEMTAVHERVLCGEILEAFAATKSLR